MPSLSSLARELLRRAEEIDHTLALHGIPPPTYENDTLETLPDDAQQLRWDLLDASHNFTQLLKGARNSGLEIALNWTDQLILRIVCHYNLASAVPDNGYTTYGEISASSGLSTPLVTRIIRAAMMLNIFGEYSPGYVCHSAISRLLAKDDEYKKMLVLQLEDIGPAGNRLIEAWQKFGDDAEDPEHCAFSLANDGKSLFNVLSHDHERANRFDTAMKHFVEQKDFNNFHIVNTFDWTKFDTSGATLVDLGGGYGQVSRILAKSTTNITFIVQDLPHVIEKGKADTPQYLQNRINFQSQNFFEPQPAEQIPDGFLISRCLHNWSDAYSTNILRCLIPALRSGSKVLIWDTVLEDSPDKRLSQKFDFQQDLIMATLFNGKDRTMEGFKRVINSADERFRIEGMRRPSGSKLALIEITWRP